MVAELFKKVASVARLKRSEFKKPDKTPYTYDHQPFSLDGKLVLDITFDNHTMSTPIYVKMDAHDPLLLSEGVCHQLGIITYHPSVAHPPATQSSSPDAHVPTIRVKPISSIRIPPMKTTVVPVQLVGERRSKRLALLEPLIGEDPLQFASSLVKIDEKGRCNMLVMNTTGFTQNLKKGTTVGEVVDAECVQTNSDSGVGGEWEEGGKGGTGGMYWWDE